MAIDTKKYDDIFRRAAEKYKFSGKTSRIFKGIVMVESTFMPRAYRYEPALFQVLKKNEPYWGDKDPSIVSASYGLAQILFTTAWALGMKPENWKNLKHHEFMALAESLYNPEVNIFYEVQLIRALIDQIWAAGIPNKYEHLSAMDVALARYNGGSGGNPREYGTLRNQSYVDKVWRAVGGIGEKEIA
jgi:hypothetical protein